MRMETRIALANAKYYKRKNILTGIAVFLSTLLLFLVPAVGYDIVKCNFAVINELYPNWHAMFGKVDGETVKKLSVHHLINRFGLRSDAGYIAVQDADISMVYLDAESFDMYHLKLSEGRLPEAENEIVVSEGILDCLFQSGKVGDTITVPYQIYRDGGLDYIQKKDFVICGLFADTEENAKQKRYTALISKSFLESEIPSGQISYYFLFQLYAKGNVTTYQLKAEIDMLAKQFDIPEQSIRINDDFLMANYLDPAFVTGVIAMIFIIVVAGIITIYSIYYVSMGERVQEFGKIKAIGATQAQLRRSVMLEGFIVAGLAIPLGLLTGTVLTKPLSLMIRNIRNLNGEMLLRTILLLKSLRIKSYRLTALVQWNAIRQPI